MSRFALILCLALAAVSVHAESLTPDRLGIVYNKDNPASVRIAQYYAMKRGVPIAGMETCFVALSTSSCCVRNAASRSAAARLAPRGAIARPESA